MCKFDKFIRYSYHFFLSCIKQISNKGVSPSDLCQFSFARRSNKGFSLYSTHPVSFSLPRWSECSTFCHVLLSFNLKAIYLFISESLSRLGGWLWSICQVDCFEWVSIPKSLRCLSNQPADYKWSPWLMTNLQWRPKSQNLRMYEAVRNFFYGRSWKCSSECYFSSKRSNSKAVKCKGRLLCSVQCQKISHFKESLCLIEFKWLSLLRSFLKQLLVWLQSAS